MLEVDDKAGAALSNDQLLDYIKKQKAKIKRLEKEKETHLKENAERGQRVDATLGARDNSPPSSDSSLFWELIERETPFRQKLAKSALNFLVGTISKSSMGKKCVASKRTLFDRWKHETLLSKMSSISADLADSTKSYTALEQKTAKLKALLARTHQSNQRFQEDTTSFKKIQRDAALQLKSLKERDESERLELLETVRARTIETAFQYDMELAIQRAADGMTQSQATSSLLNQNSNNSSSRKYTALEEENDLLKQKIADEIKKYTDLKEESRGTAKKLEKLEKDSLTAQDLIKSSNKKISELEYMLSEDVRERKDLEVELELVTKGRGEMIRNMEINAREKHRSEIEILRKELAAMKDVQRKNTSYEAELSAANIRIEQQMSAIATLKKLNANMSSHSISNSNSAFLNTYTSSSSLNPGIIGTAPVPNKLPHKYALSNPGNIMPPGGLIGNGAQALGSRRGSGAKLGGRTDGQSYIADMETSSSPCPTPRSPSDSEAVTTYASESLVLKAADDFRLIIVIPDKKSFRMTWTFSVSPFVKRKNGAAKKTAADTSSPSSSSSSPQTTSNMDIGFTVIEKRGDGSLPQLIPYSRVKGLHNKVATFRIDGETNGNILRGKEREREREREETDDDALNGHGDSGWGGVAASAVPLSNLIEFSPDTPTSEKSRSLSTSQKTITASSSTAELESCVNVREHGGVDKRRTGDGEEAVGRGDEVEGSTGAGVRAERTLIVLFDNSYSWYTAKEIKYAVTVEIL